MLKYQKRQMKIKPDRNIPSRLGPWLAWLDMGWLAGLADLARPAGPWLSGLAYVALNGLGDGPGQLYYPGTIRELSRI